MDGASALRRLSSSNPRSRAGSDWLNRHQYGQPSQGSNPRSRAGSDRALRRLHRGGGGGSNPRSRAGSDDVTLKFSRSQHNVPIHAPARGATHGDQAGGGGRARFQSTLPRGERRGFGFGKEVVKSGSNPRSRAGSDKRRSIFPLRYREFQSTLPRGERLTRERARRCATRFQSTLPRGERRF